MWCLCVLSACLSAILLCGSQYLLLSYEIPVSSWEFYLEVSVIHAYYTNTPHTFKIHLIHCVDTASHLTGFFFFACDYNPHFLVYSCRHGTKLVDLIFHWGVLYLLLRVHLFSLVCTDNSLLLLYFRKWNTPRKHVTASTWSTISLLH